MHAWPAESTKRSRSGHSGWSGACFMTSVYSTYASGASAIAVPGCPEFAFCTASIARHRIVSIERVWTRSSTAVKRAPHLRHGLRLAGTLVDGEGRDVPLSDDSETPLRRTG